MIGDTVVGVEDWKNSWRTPQISCGLSGSGQGPMVPWSRSVPVVGRIWGSPRTQQVAPKAWIEDLAYPTQRHGAATVTEAQTEEKNGSAAKPSSVSFQNPELGHWHATI